MKQVKTQRKPKLNINKPEESSSKYDFFVAGFYDHPLTVDITLQINPERDAKTIIEWIRSQVSASTFREVVKRIKEMN